jgi:hypothetical protein
MLGTPDPRKPQGRLSVIILVVLVALGDGGLVRRQSLEQVLVREAAQWQGARRELASSLPSPCRTSFLWPLTCTRQCNRSGPWP